MMSFAKIRDGKYYLDLATEDYYLQGGEPDGIWCGSGSSLLKLKCAVASDALSKKLQSAQLAAVREAIAVIEEYVLARDLVKLVVIDKK
jgi:hypothetical protein